MVAGVESRFAFDGAVPGGVLRGTLTRPPGPGPFPCVVQVHGYTLHADWGFHPEFAARLAARGVASLRFDFSGDGRDADGAVDVDVVARNTYVAELADLAAVRAWLDAAPRIDTARLALVGHSRGGAMGLIHAAEDGRYRTVVTWAAIDAILNFSAERLERWRRDGRIDIVHHALRRRVWLGRDVLDAAEAARDRLDVLAAVARLDVPILAIHGARDRALPATSAERIVAAARHPESRLSIHPDAGHAFGARDPLLRPLPGRLRRLLDETVDWCVRRSGGDRPRP